MENPKHQKVFLFQDTLAGPLCMEPLTILVIQSPSLQANLCWLSPAAAAAQIKGKMEHHDEECPSSSPPRCRNTKGITLRDGSNVDRNIDSWWNVLKETKEAIWGLVENAYVIDVVHKKNILSRAALRFKDFKSTLNNGIYGTPDRWSP
ncbi:hypothetical protein Dimus_005384 [Dionaea muscipula]